MKRYAANTQVTADRSRGEIEGQLDRFGASAFGYWKNERSAQITFRYAGMMVRLSIPIPERDHSDFKMSPAKRKRTPAVALKAWEQEVRRRWRSLAAVLKAKLIAINDGVASFEEEFLPYLVLADGQTIAERMLPKIRQFLDAGEELPKCLPLLEGT